MDVQLNDANENNVHAALDQRSLKCLNKLNSSPLSPTVLPWDTFSQWIYCICVVTFDLELGQAMEVSHQISKVPPPPLL